MVPWLFLAVGLVLGTALGAGILHARSSSRLAVSEAAAGELRRQLEQIGAESSDLKAKLEEEQRARVQAETLLQSEREKLQEEQNQFDEARARLSETFQGLAGEALKSNNQAFLELATQTLEKLRAQGVGTWTSARKPSKPWSLLSPNPSRPMPSASTTWSGGGKQPTGT